MHPGAVDWEALARTGGTLVVLMGMAARAEIARRLMAAGRGADTPVVVVRRGTTTTQASARTTLAGLAEVELGPPCTIVIGAVAGLDLLERRGGAPDRASSVVVTRARAQAGALVSALRDAGASVIELPVIAIADPPDGGAALRAEAARADSYDWIVLTSANAVERFVGIMRDVRGLGAARLAVVGAATARALAAHRLRRRPGPRRGDRRRVGGRHAAGSARRAGDPGACSSCGRSGPGTWSVPGCGTKGGT